MDTFSEIFVNRQDYTGYLKKLCASRRYVVFYGCGMIFPEILANWRELLGQDISYVCDADPAKWGKSFEGLECISPTRLLEIKDDAVVFITAGKLLETGDSLKKLGIDNCHPIYYRDIRFGRMAEYDSAAAHEKLSQAYKLLADSASQRVFATLMQRIFQGSSDLGLMASICENDQYFPRDIFPLNGHESFADIGAFDGDTVVEFLKHANGKFDNIYAFELCRNNFDKLQTAVSGYPNHSHIHCFNTGCWDSREEVKYNMDRSSSTIGKGITTGWVDRLDSMLADKPVTFIKMDIEGAEMNALRGAENIIRTQKPKMAVCVYHDLRHFYEVPLYLKSLVPEYKIYFRHHTQSCYETVCYAHI